MFVLFFFFISSFVLVAFLKLLSVLISDSTMFLREELSSYECGFEHHNLSRIPFSLRYFFLTLIFLIFDLEIVLMLFLPSAIYSQSLLFSLFLLVVFLITLLLGLVYEWNDGSLEWVS